MVDASSFDKIGSPRCSCSRSSQGCSNSSTTDRTSCRCHGCHRTGRGSLTEPPNIFYPHCSGSNHGANSTTIFSVCVNSAACFQNHGKSDSGKALGGQALRTSLCGGEIPSVPPLSAATQRQAVYKKGSPRCPCSRPSQGSPKTRTTDRTSCRSHGSHRTGRHRPAHC